MQNSYESSYGNTCSLLFLFDCGRPYPDPYDRSGFTNSSSVFATNRTRRLILCTHFVAPSIPPHDSPPPDTHTALSCWWSSRQPTDNPDWWSHVLESRWTTAEARYSRIIDGHSDFREKSTSPCINSVSHRCTEWVTGVNPYSSM